MTGALDIPKDLIDLQRAAEAAELAYTGFAQRVAAERRELFPEPEQAVERACWPEEQTAELQRLRSAYSAAIDAVRAHPLLCEAREQGSFHQAVLALREAARAEGEGEPEKPSEEVPD